MLSFQVIIHIVLVGIGATVVMDVWSLILKKLNIPTLDYAMVGRWIGHLTQGTYHHEHIAKSTSVAGEKPLGWAVHYLTGVVFSLLLVSVTGSVWLDKPTLLPALAVGIGTIVFPWFVMQPAMGAGIMASRTPNPTKSRILSILAHTAFGVGLYLTAIGIKCMGI